MKKSFAILIILLVVQLTAYTVQGQQQTQITIDSLKTELSKVKNDKDKVMILNGLSEHAGWRINDNEACLDYAQKALDLAKKIGYKDGIARSLNNIGNAQSQKFEREEAMKNYFAALKIFQETGNTKWQGMIYINIAINYQDMSNYPQAIKYYKAAIKPITEAEDQDKLASIYSGIGYVNLLQGNTAGALINDSIAIAIYRKHGNKKEIARLLLNIGDVYTSQGDITKALENQKMGLKTAEEINDTLSTARALLNIGSLYSAQGYYPEALKEFYKALKISEETNFKSGIASSQRGLGGIYMSQGNYSEALKNYNIYLDNSKEMKDKNMVSQGYYMVAGVYAAQNDYHNALENYSAALEVCEEIGSQLCIAYSNIGIGSVNEALSDYPAARQNYFEALKIFESVGDKTGVANSYYGIGSVYVKLNQAKEGEKWLRKSLTLTKEVGIKDGIKEVYKILSEADSALANYKGAYENHKMYIVYRDSMFNEETTKKLTQTAMQYEFDKKEAATKAEQEKKDIRQRNIRNSSFAPVGGLLLFSLVVVRQRNKVKKEKKRNDVLLLNILPHEVAEELKAKGSAEAKQFDEVSILFTDFVSFTQTAENLSAKQLVQELNMCFTAFDNIVERNGLEKIKTIGDAYLAVCGLPAADPEHAKKTVQAALEIRDFITERSQREKTFEVRVGIHSGPVVAGIVGVKKFAYDIWGDTVNTAARMESSGEAGKVNISEATYNLVNDDFTCEYRGEVDAKNKGKMKMYFVESARS